MMDLKQLEIPEVKVISPKKFADERGFFSETYNAQRFADAGIDIAFVQDNHSLSRTKGVLRGLHYQAPPHAQDKLLQVIRGAILDVAVDIRHKSPTFGKSVAIEISAEKWNQILIPKGFAHGFLTLTPDTEVHYKVSDFYAQESEYSIAWNDPELNIDWPVSEDQVTLSAKDKDAMSFAEYKNAPAF